MSLTKENLIGLLVFTKSQQLLGKVANFELDPLTQTIVTYHIKSRDIIKEWLQPELLIGRDQVISISQEKMIVDDNVVIERQTKKQAVKKPVSVS